MRLSRACNAGGTAPSCCRNRLRRVCELIWPSRDGKFSTKWWKWFPPSSHPASRNDQVLAASVLFVVYLRTSSLLLGFSVWTALCKIFSMKNSGLTMWKSTKEPKKKVPFFSSSGGGKLASLKGFLVFIAVGCWANALPPATTVCSFNRKDLVCYRRAGKSMARDQWSFCCRVILTRVSERVTRCCPAQITRGRQTLEFGKLRLALCFSPFADRWKWAHPNVEWEQQPATLGLLALLMEKRF